MTWNQLYDLLMVNDVDWNTDVIVTYPGISDSPEVATDVSFTITPKKDAAITVHY